MRRLFLITNSAFEGWRLGAIATSLLVLMPILGLSLLALGDSSDIWPSMLQTVLPRYILTTLALTLGVASITACIGTLTAWFVTFFSFPGRNILVWAMLLPLALPTYIAAYCYTDLLDYAGPVFTLWRAWLPLAAYPNVHSLGGAIIILSFVLYPYVYLSARTSFIQQSTGLIENARLLGLSPKQCFWRVALPLSRPAIALGVLLAVMECLNDIGAVEHLGVQTLTTGIYSTWINRGSLAGAAQLALAMLSIVALLIVVEHGLRKMGSFQSSRLRNRSIRRFDLSPLTQWSVFLFCLFPIILGFGIPVWILLANAHSPALDTLQAAGNSLSLALSAAIVTVLIAIFLAYARRSAIPEGRGRLARLAAIGYAIPGTVLGLGLLIVLTRLTHMTSGSIILTGTVFGLLYAYSVRFLSLAYGTIDDGFDRIPRSFDLAARSLGASRRSVLTRLHSQLMRAPLIAALLLVFVDAMKELPATLILRPFNFETLSTQVYTQASLGQFEQAALPALTIVAVGLIPIFIMLQLFDRLRQKSHA